MSDGAQPEDVADERLGELAALGVSLGHSCYRQLIWECRLQDRDAVERLRNHLLELNYADESTTDWIAELAAPEGHRVVVVPRTGRVQIRVHYLTPHEARPDAAIRVARQLANVQTPANSA